jgi:dienelactone hydrolase
MLRAALAVGLVLLAAGCGGGDKAVASRPSLFAYDHSAPLRYRDRGRVNHGYPVQVRDVSYAGPRGGLVHAYLVLPPGKGPFPAVLYLHGSGEDRTSLVVPAAWLAARGAVALAIDSAFVGASGPEPTDPVGRLERERDLTAETVVDLRRGVDVLASLPQVDERRLGFVGYSSGAKIGAILAGVEPRIRAYDLMSGGSAPVSSFVAAAPQDLRGPVGRVLGQIDPLRYVRRAAPSALFFQDGLDDTVVPHAQLAALAAAGSEPKRIRWYRADHDLDAQAFRDQLAWLSRELAIRGPAVPGARTGP